MSNIITRDEYNKYIAVKGKLGLQDKGTQTDNEYFNEMFINNQQSTILPMIYTIIPKIHKNVYGDDYEEGQYENDDDDYDYEYDGDDDGDGDDNESDEDDNETSDDTQTYKKSKSKKRRYTNPENEDYFQNLSSTERKRLKKIEDDLYDDMKKEMPLRFLILSSHIDDNLKTVCLKKLDQLDNMRSRTDEYYKLLQWVESVARLPVGKYKQISLNKESSAQDISMFLNGIMKRLDENVYGHQTTKEHIIRLLAKWISNKHSNGLVIGIEGEMGVGKTSLCLEICKALELPYGFVSLGGLSNSEYLVGHSYTYEGSKWGKIAEILMHAKYSNPIIYFDELDKVSHSKYGDEIINTLIHITDNTQNFDFRDKYFSEVSLDLSKCIIIFSYNHGDTINPILKDRMITLKAQSYNTNDKLVISKKHMIPSILQEYGFVKEQLVFTDDVIKFVIQQTEDEHGVRKLKRSLEEIISQINVCCLMKKGIFSDTEPIDFPLNITEKVVSKLLPKLTGNELKNPYMYT